LADRFEATLIGVAACAPHPPSRAAALASLPSSPRRTSTT
jgi:hypothetical protein